MASRGELGGTEVVLKRGQISASSGMGYKMGHLESSQEPEGASGEEMGIVRRDFVPNA